MEATQTHSDTIRDRLEAVLERIETAARRARRNPAEIKLVVVTKGHTVNTVQAAIDAAAQRLGENYAEEGVAKMQALGVPPGVEWHMIGHIQSRKAGVVAGHYDFIHSLDSLKVAQRLDQTASKIGKTLPVLLECNVSGEETKYGFPAVQDPIPWEAELARIIDLPHLEVCGLMAMAPYSPDAESARPYFARLRRLRDQLAGKFHSVSWSELSMGMSADFEIAVQEGATLVRIGEAILGPRPPKK